MSETIAHYPANHMLDATEIVSSLVETTAFQENKHEGYPTSRALARTALELAGMDHNVELEDDYEPRLIDTGTTPETALNALTGTLPAFVHGLEGIRHSHTISELPPDTYRSMKGYAARFNHSVKAMIEQDTSLNFRNVTDTVTTLYGVMNRDRWGTDRAGYEKEAKWFSGQFDARLRGMQQEVLAHQIINCINLVDPLIDPKTRKKQPRVSIDTNVSVEDDLNGADMYITLDGVTFPIDIKASERTAENTRKKSEHPKSIITTGFTTDELMGAFRVNTKRARKAAPAMLEKLYAARAEYMHIHNITREDLNLAA